MVDPSRIQITGPLKSYVEHVWSELLAQGYTALSSRLLLNLMAHLSRWLEGIGLQARELTNKGIEDFLEKRREAGYTKHLSRRALEPILEHLQTAGLVFELEPAKATANERDRLLEEYRQYLIQERAVVPVTVRHYESIARNFLSDVFGENRLELDRLCAADVVSFVVRQSHISSVSWAKYTVTALRSVLRFLFLRGELANDLVGAVPGVAAWRQASLPKALPLRQVQQLLRNCDRRTHLGRRDFAVLTLLVRFGLRAGEVADLELDDIHWTRGEIVIRGKGLREDRLPLACDVAEAIVAYLRRSRPQTSCRRFFLSSIAPLRGITGCAVGRIVHRACIRAGLAPIGSHRLRHSAATQMLRKGASLSEIAQVLRHRKVDTTAIYAKVDRRGLRELARPWPGDVA
ncbi:MAG TPA: tyrosine-type recombinase/integrase [Vicinamibacteria bacterium]|nr:tyrosine-type recombinase/integrase [Vicinamibacteria bacterium]